MLLIFFSALACEESEAPPEEPPTNNDELPAVYEKIYGASDIYLDDDFVVIKTEGIPDHKSPYYEGTQWENDLYEAYNGSNPDFRRHPNRISAREFPYRIPLNPEEASNKRATALGSIGISLNGVAFFNQYAGPNNEPLTFEFNSFDQYAGHPQQQGTYHYHVEPLWLTREKGEEALKGFLLDGYPDYGPMENGRAIRNSDLDEYHGHIHATEDFPNGIYHYHITDADPYINGSGYYGTPGTVTR